MTATEQDVVAFDDLETRVQELATGQQRWSSVPRARRAELLHEVARLALDTADTWVEAACRAKKIAPGSPLAGEEWLSGPYPIATNAATLAHSIEQLVSGKSPLDNVPLESAPGGRLAAKVFPGTIWDRLLLSGFEARVWFQQGVSADEARMLSGLAQRNPELTGGISVVLGAGNITSIAVLDTLYELFAHNRVVILKLNPILGALYEPTLEVLAPLIAIDAVRVVTGGVEVGSFLIDHRAVTHVHITGSSASHDAIVYGPGAEGARRKADNAPVLGKTMSSELGGVSPTIVVPDRWSRRDIRFQAEHIATQRLHNSGHNCIAAQVVVLPASWSQKDRFLAALRREIDAAPPRTSFYPGTPGRLDEAVSTHVDHAARCDNDRVLIQGLAPNKEAPAFAVEYFSPVLAVVEVQGSGTEYLAGAAAFVNQHLTGTLGANVLVHPKVARRLGDRWDSFLESLHYGTIAVNAWTAVGYLTAAAPWGGFPGATLDNVESGMGVVHNALLLADTERTVIKGPFRPFPRSVVTGQMTITPKPAWFVRNRMADRTGRLLVQFVGKPTAAKLPRIFASALRG